MIVLVIFQWVMPDGDRYPFAEERRLFYVALTRARRRVLLVTVEHRWSEFATELVGDRALTPQRFEAANSARPVPVSERAPSLSEEGFYTLAEFLAAQSVTLDDVEASKWGKRATQLSHQRGLTIEVRTVENQRFPTVNAYRLEILREVLADLLPSAR